MQSSILISPQTKSKAVLSGILIALLLSDAILSCLFVTAFGVQAEANPAMRWLFEHVGVAGFLAAKIGSIALWVAISPRAHWLIHVALIALMAQVVWLGAQMVFLI